ncbi:MAG: hypothetical protein HQL56_19045 [Magnetococcales bacterium]|nr:hypothetical protein [Magnetococcales bacterium]
MTAVARVIRNTPALGLRDYFAWRGMDAGGIFNARGRGSWSSTHLLKAMEGMTESEQGTVNADFDRIQAMTDEPGQWAIFQTAIDKTRLEGLANPHERAMWLFRAEPAAFRQAEEIRYTDTRRQGRMWSGFVGPRHLVPSRDTSEHRRFEEKVCSLFGSRNARLDLFERTRPGRDSQPERLVQAVIYRDGLPDAGLEFNALGELELRPRRPVFELAITYEPNSGVIEVVANGVEQRTRLARLFAEIILQQGILGLRIPLRQYDLSRLLAPCDFPTDPEDGIDAVKVTWLKLRRQASTLPCIALISKWEDRHSVHEHAQHLIVAPEGMPQQFQTDEAIISIRLRPARGSTGRRRTINVTITLPNGCNLKSKTEKERLICDKYLPLWGLVKEI